MHSFPDCKKTLIAIVVGLWVAFLACFAWAPPSIAETPREAVGNELLATNQTMTPLIQAITKCLQERGMWPPSGPLQQMCGQVQIFRQNVATVAIENQKRMPYVLLRAKMQALEQSATMIEAWLMSMQPTEEVAQRWGETKAAFVKANKAFFAGASNPGWERHYDSHMPDSSYFRGQGMKYYVGVTQRENQELCLSIKSYLQSKNRWGAAGPQGTDLELCMALNALNKQLAQLTETGGDGCEAEGQVVEISENRKNIERLIPVTGLNQVAAKDWFEVRTGLSDIVQGFCKQCPAAAQLGLDAEAEPAAANPAAAPAQQSATEQPSEPAPEESQF